MKRFLLILLAVLMTGCTAHEPDSGILPDLPDRETASIAVETIPNPLHNMPDLPEGYTVLPTAAHRIYPWNGMYYTLTELADGWEMGTCSADGMTYTPLYTFDTEVRDLFVGGSGIFVLTDRVITHLDHTGAVLGTYETAFDGSSDTVLCHNSLLCADDTYIILSWRTWTEGEGRDSLGSPLWQYVVTITDLAGGGTSELPLTDEVYHIAPSGSGTFVLIQPRDPYLSDIGTTYQNCGLYLLDPASKTITPDEDYIFPFRLEPVYNSADGRVYYDASSKSTSKEFACSVKGDDSIHRILSLRQDTHIAATRAAVGEDAERPGAAAFYTGYDIILYDRNNHCTAVLDLASPEDEVLTLLIPHDNYIGTDESFSRITEGLSYEIAAFEEASGAHVQCTTYPANELVQRLRMKMLAGEDDFDVVYYDTKYDNFTAPLLTYGLYLPLEESAVIDANFDNYMDGVREIMTFDGHLYGVPRNIVPDAAFIGMEYRMAGLPQIDADWTEEDFWNVCEAAMELDGDVKLGGSVMTGLYSLLEQGLQTGEMDEEAIAQYLTALKKYTDAGVFSGESQFPLIDTLPLSPSLVINLHTPRFRNQKIVPMPAVNGVRYAKAETFLFINAKTKHRELALKYMELMSSPDIAGQIVKGKSMLLKDVSMYYEITGGMNIDLSWEDYEKTPPKDMEKLNVVCEAMAAALSGTSPCVYILDDEFPAEVSEIRDAVMDGRMTPEEGAEKLSYAARYRYLE